MVWASWGKSWGGGSGAASTYLLVNTTGADIEEFDLTADNENTLLMSVIVDVDLSVSISEILLSGNISYETNSATVEEDILSCEVVE